LEFVPIGIVHTPYTSLDEIPRCAADKLEEDAVVEVYQDFAEGLRDIEGFSHLMLLVYLHEARETKLTVLPPIDDQVRGVFATRSPMRPSRNSIKVGWLEGKARYREAEGP
jgi:tRNA-Thr(GGU) m(6)t(6)A37 methyltransferase TsaA